MHKEAMRYGDIWLVSSDPSVGREYRGVRPAVVVQKHALPRDSGLVTVLLMSSFKGKQHKEDILVQPSQGNRLWKPTLVKVQHIQSYDTTRFIRRIGTLESDHVEEIRAYLRRHFELE